MPPRPSRVYASPCGRVGSPPPQYRGIPVPVKHRRIPVPVERLLTEKEAALHALRDAVHCCRLALPSGPNEEKSELLGLLGGLKDRLGVEIVAVKLLGVAEAELQSAHLWRRRIHNAIEDLKGQVRVFCRMRPFDGGIAPPDAVPMDVLVDGMSLEVPGGGVFCFDGVFAPGDQETIFQDCSDLVQSAVDGHNVTIFAYGQTGAGKTHTMYGSSGDQEGIVPRTIREVFEVVMNSEDRAEPMVTVSLVELYNNQFIDLLAGKRATGQGRTKTGLHLRHDKDGAGLDGLTEQRVKSAFEALGLLRGGVARRSVSCSKMNALSSRSHLILTVRVRSVDRATGEKLQGKILLCDLAGSERLKKSEAAGDRMKEAIEINKSLTSLGDVFEAVSRGQNVVPYRNHKLTQILQDSIGGTAKTLMFVNLSTDPSSESETMMSLKYAARAKNIVNGVSRRRVEPP